jgi:hypothetical protein
MPNYRRAFVPGGCWFFTVNLLKDYGDSALNIQSSIKCTVTVIAVIRNPTLMEAGSSAGDEDAAANGIRRRENEDGGLR